MLQEMDGFLLTSLMDSPLQRGT